MSVRRGIDAMRRVGDRNIAGIFRSLPAIENRDFALISLEVAGLDARFDGGNVEDHGPVLFRRRHLLKIDAFFRVVAGRDGIFALIVGVHIVQISINDHLPGNLHAVAVDGGEDGVIFLGLVEDHPVIGKRDAVFAIGEDIAGAREFLRPQPMNIRRVGDRNDLVGLHDIAANARDPRIGLVVHENIAAVIGALW